MPYNLTGVWSAEFDAEQEITPCVGNRSLSASCWPPKLLLTQRVIFCMKAYKPNPVMNGHKSDVPDLTKNETGDRLRNELSQLPHTVKDNEVCLATPAKIKILSFLLENGFVWSEHSVSHVSQNCFVTARNDGRAWWTVVDYKLL